jgi:hypothetical protein
MKHQAKEERKNKERRPKFEPKSHKSKGGHKGVEEEIMFQSPH